MQWQEWLEQPVTLWWTTYQSIVLRSLAAIAIALLLHLVAFFLAKRITRRSRWEIDDQVLSAAYQPSRWLLILLALLTIPVEAHELSDRTHAGLRHAMSILVVFLTVRLLLRLTRVIDESVKRRHPLNAADNFMARRVHTQMTVLRRTANVFIVFVGVAAIMMTFPRIRELGTGLLASAGIAGVIVGLALRPILENLLAGLQIALTQPIKIEDSVVIEGEVGAIEEINSTYVVVRVWDERRLIVPLSKFIQEPFQNWSRRTTRILGTLFLYADYNLPVQSLREEFLRLVHGSKLWDGRVAVLQVTEALENSIQIRCLISAESASKSWDLRVELREQLIGFIQRHYPESLPSARITLRPIHPDNNDPRPEAERPSGD